MSRRSMTWPPPIPFRPQIGQLADTVRRRISRVDDAEVRKARKLARVCRSGKIDVVYFGDSTTSFVATYDTDRRPLHRMMRDLLGEGTRIQAVHGGSYNPALYTGFLRFIASSDARPLVILPHCIRVRTVPWMEHPIHGRKKAIEFLAQLDPAVPLRKIRKGFPPPAPEEWDMFHKISYPTWAGDWTIGEYVERLRGAPEDDEERVKLLYAYHHGGRIPSGAPLEDVTRLGEELRRLNLPVVAYQTPVPVQQGEEFYAGFRELATQNFADLNDAFVAGYGNEAEVLQTGMDFSTAEFIDYRDASEHLNEHGRLRLAESITTAARLAIEDRSMRGA